MSKRKIEKKAQKMQGKALSANGNAVKEERTPEKEARAPSCIKYPSAELSLQVVMNEYNRSFEVSNSLTTRGGVLLSAILAAFMIALTSINFEYIFNLTIDVIFSPPYCVLILVVFLHVSSGILSFVFLLLSVTATTFQAVNCNDISKSDYLAYSSDRVSKSIIGSLNLCLQENDTINKKRANNYNCGAWFGASTVILFLLILIIQRVIE